MNTSKIKSYAIQARRDFIKAVTERANFYGIFSDNNIEEIKFKGDVAIIGDRAITKKEGELRQLLVDRIKRDGFEMVVQASAYTWFNRFVAIRYMELHNYLEHGFRVLSHPSGSDMPEILEHVVDINLHGLNKEKVIELRLAGNKDNELYRLLIIAQCNALNSAMPFLFDRIDSDTELLLPDNLLHSDSPIRKLVTQIDESDWQNVEVIGWIYQFYISEKKDEVIGKVVKSEDIPAATQLFTPNWIVKYMVQNTLGRMWLATYPDSPLRSKMEYYIEPAEQEPEVRKQIDAITPKELNPETITFLDPASGSGHILVEAYDIFKEIYLERGYRTRDIPKLILEKNLYGLDICDRAAQLAGFAVLMRARADDRKILSDNHLKLNIMAIQSTAHLNAKDLANKLLKEKVVWLSKPNTLFPESDGQLILKNRKRYEINQEDIIELINLFENAKTFGSLITIPEHITGQLEAIGGIVDEKLKNGDLFEKDAAGKLLPIVKQAMILARKYDCVVTNPPYMGNKGMNAKLKDFAQGRFPDSKSDLFAMFIERGLDMTVECGFNSMVTMQSWMFLSSYEKLRERLLNQYSIICMVHMANMVMRIAFGTTATVWHNLKQPAFRGNFSYVYYEDLTEKDKPKQFPMKNNRLSIASAADFKKIPGSPIAYWVSNSLREVFKYPKIESITISDGQNKTGNNDKFVREHWEVSMNYVGIESRWFFYAKGGGFRRWYGNLDEVVDWSESARYHYRKDHVCRIIPEYLWYKKGVTWGLVTSAKPSFRLLPSDATFDVGGSSIFFINDEDIEYTIGLLNTKLALTILKICNPTINFQVRNIREIPFAVVKNRGLVEQAVKFSIELSKSDWDFHETSWDFNNHPLLHPNYQQSTLKKTYDSIRKQWCRMSQEMQRLEEENNRIFIKAYELEDELTPDVPLSEITLTCNPHYRYGGIKTEEELETLLLTDTINELISYSIGCMMGRYSMDEPGLIYAHSGNIGFDPTRYKTFSADEDGIIPIMDMDWFLDDAANRFVKFIKVAWTPETLNENLKFVADSLNPKRGEDPIDTIRRYLSTGFFKDHLKTYKKRPIYWLFSSGKQKAFECLVYLHRYNESTLSRMRGTYVTPLIGKLSARLEYLQNEKNAATTASDQRKFQKEIDMLKKKQAELSKFNDELKHYADMRISLDLDDGVKVNYGKFGNLLAEVKAITGE